MQTFIAVSPMEAEGRQIDKTLQTNYVTKS